MQRERFPRDSMRQQVRRATRSDHKRIDETMSSLELADRIDYGMFLNIHYMALGALGGRWREQDEPDFSALLHCLIDDLQVFGIVRCSPVAASRSSATLQSRWGVAYVIRGSRLGGAILRQRVPSTYPTSFLDFAPALTWPDFLRQLDQQVPLDSHARGRVISGAKQAFEAFDAAAAATGNDAPRTVRF